MNFQSQISLLLGGLLFIALPNCSCDTEVYTLPSPALIIVMPDEIDFGRVPLDSFASRSFTILNEGKTQLTVSSFSLSPADAPFATERNTTTVGAESSVDVVIHFRPTAETAYEAVLTIHHDASNDETQKTILLKGLGSNDVICTSCGGKDAECQEDTLVTYENIGGCEEDQCLYQAIETLCECGCDAITASCLPCLDAGEAPLPEIDAGELLPEVMDAGEMPVITPDAGSSAPEIIDAGETTVAIPDAGEGATAIPDAGVFSPEVDAGETVVIIPDAGPLGPESENYRAVIAANIERTCGITSDGQVKCWGKCDIAPTCPEDGMWGNSTGENPADMQAMDFGFKTAGREELTALQREIDLLKLLKNPYIVKYMESFNTRETLYIVMEFVENGSLASIVKRCREPTRSPALHVAPPRPAGMGGCPSRLPACIRCRCAACASPRFLGKL